MSQMKTFSAPMRLVHSLTGSGPAVARKTKAAEVPADHQVLTIDTRDALAALTPGFSHLLQSRFDLGALTHKLCPAALDNGHVVVMMLEAYVGSEQLAALIAWLNEEGCVLAETPYWVLPAPLLLSIVRGQIDASSLKQQRHWLRESSQSSMAAAFREIVEWGVRLDASDIHVNVSKRQQESEIRYTVGGRYLAPERFKGMQAKTLMEILAVAYMDIQGGNGAVFDPTIEQQGSIRMRLEQGPIVLRWASLATDQGASVTLRILRSERDLVVQDYAALGYLDSQVATIARALNAEGGAVILAGVVGSGKSTTLATMMSSIPPHRKIITLEDPVEYRIPNALQNSVSRSLNSNTLSEFDAKLKTIKRSAMNDLLIGEVRDRATGRAFMDLTSSGSNVYTTTHAGSAALIVDRLASDFIGVSRHFLATPGMLKLLVYQALLPVLCPACSLSLPLCAADAEAARQSGRACDTWQSYLLRIQTLYHTSGDQLRVRNPQGCPQCEQTQLKALNGYAGRTVVAEMLEPGLDPDFRLRTLQRREEALMPVRQRSPQRFDDPDMQGKSAMECAVYKMLLGQIDPRDVENRFHSFETEALRRAGLSPCRSPARLRRSGRAMSQWAAHRRGIKP